MADVLTALDATFLELDIPTLAYGIEEGIEELLALVPGAEHLDAIEPARR